MFNNILGLAIRSAVDWLSRRSYVRGTARPVSLYMTTAVCPSKSRAPQPSMWNLFHVEGWGAQDFEGHTAVVIYNDTGRAVPLT